MKRKLSFSAIFVLSLVVALGAFSVQAFADGAAGAGSTLKVTDFGANGQDGNDDFIGFRDTMIRASQIDGAVTVEIPAGTYYLSDSVPIFSGTTLKAASGVKVISKIGTGVMIYSLHYDENGNFCNTDACKHGGYSQIKDVVIDGGTWIANNKSDKANNLIFQFRHGENITVKNTVCEGASNHFINMSGIKNAHVENVVFQNAAKYTGDDPDFWGEYTPGDDERYTTLEALHIDYMDEVWEGNGFPLDGTAPDGVTVKNCTFNKVYAGIGTHHYSKKANNVAKGITIEGNHFENILPVDKTSGNCVNAYGYTGLVVKDNEAVNGSGKYQYREFLNSMGSNSTVTGNKISKASETGIYLAEGSVSKVSGNTVENGREGIRVTNGEAKKASTATVSGNTLKSFADTAITVDGASKAECTNNAIQGAGDSGITVLGKSSATLTGNKMTGVKMIGINIRGQSSATVKNNSVDGKGTGTRAGIDIQEKSGAKTACAVSGNSLKNLKENAITLNGASKANFVKNTIENIGAVGIYVAGGSASTIKENTLKNIATASKTHAIYVLGKSTKATVQNNKITTVSSSGIAVYSGAKATVQGNTITGSKMHALNLTQAAAGSKLVKNTVNKPAITGILLDKCGKKIVINGNKVNNAGLQGISINNTDNVTVQSNTVDTAKDIGINLKCSKGSLIKSNKVLKAKGNGIQVAGTAKYTTTVTIQQNTSKGPANKKADIRVGDYSVNCKVVKNKVGSRGITVSKKAKGTVIK